MRRQFIGLVLMAAAVSAERLPIQVYTAGIDKVIFQVELYQLPTPEFRVTEHATIAILYAPRQLRGMDCGDRIRACYQHAALQYVSGEVMTNTPWRPA